MSENKDYVLLIGNNYISKFLLKTAKENDIPTFAEDSLANSIKKISTIKNIYNIDKLKTYLKRHKKVYFYLNSDDCPTYIFDNSSDNFLINSVNSFKDKNKFRNLIKHLFKDFYFKKLNIKELKKYKIPKHRVVIIKPNKGFFGTGVRKIKQQKEWKEKITETLYEVNENSKYFSKDILDTKNYLIEDFVKGEEYAVDMFYDSKSNPVIMNIYHHPYKDENDTRNVLYYTNTEIMERLQTKLIKFFNDLVKKIKVSNFPIHAEFRETKEGKLIPIEVNPLRFGGFSLADLTYWAYGYNPYEYFFKNIKPNWPKIYKDKKDLHFGWILAYNGDLDLNKYEPDHEKFKKTFSKILYYNKLDYKKYPVFATVYAESKNLKDLYKYLNIDFSKYFKKIK